MRLVVLLHAGFDEKLQIFDYANLIAAPLPKLWEESGQEYMLKQAILTTLTRLITALKDDSPIHHALAVPLIKQAVDKESVSAFGFYRQRSCSRWRADQRPSQGAQVYLLEDGLDLWRAIIVQTPKAAPPEILSLAPYLFPIFELGTEHLNTALQITESYVLLAPQSMLESEMRTRLLTALAPMLGTLRPVPNGNLTRLIDVMLREADLLGGEEGVSVIATGLVEYGVMYKLIDGLRGSWEAHQTSGPNRVTPAVDGLIETDYFSILARLVLCSRRVFLRALESLRPRGSDDIHQAMDWLLTEWFSHFGNMSHEIHRKLNCLALTSLLETGAPWILNRLQDLMTVWTDVITELEVNSYDPGRE